MSEEEEIDSVQTPEVSEETPEPASHKQRKKAEIEALLFATNGLTVAEISKRTGFVKSEVSEFLEELELEHMKDSRGVQVVQEGDVWKMSIRPDITPNLKDLLPPEIPSALVKTLAIIAANKPVKQSTIVHVRGNKAYEHIKKLVKLGFITAERKGLTNILDLTQKFFAYFNVPKEVLERAIKQEIGEEGAAQSTETPETAAEEPEKEAKETGEILE